MFSFYLSEVASGSLLKDKNLFGFVLIQNKYKKRQFFYSCDKNHVTHYIGEIAQVDAGIKSSLVI